MLSRSSVSQGRASEKFCVTMSFFTAFMDWLRSLFFSRELEITLVGLQNSGELQQCLDSMRGPVLHGAGKTSLVNVLAVCSLSLLSHLLTL